MIISYDYNFLFIKPAKVAGTSMKKTLEEVFGKENLTLKYSRKRKEKITKHIVKLRDQYATPADKKEEEKANKIINDFGYMKKFMGGHCTASRAHQLLGEGVWQHLFKWSIVRNPFDRIISSYVWLATKEERATKKKTKTP